jgi:beta-lactamase regulating signal transducer with metallopeptidase domain
MIAWNLLLGSVGLLLAASVAWVLLRLWHRQPLTSYRLLVAVLVATLLLPVGQIGLQHAGVEVPLPFAERLAALQDDLAGRDSDAVRDDQHNLFVLGTEAAPVGVLLHAALSESGLSVETGTSDDPLLRDLALLEQVILLDLEGAGEEGASDHEKEEDGVLLGLLDRLSSGPLLAGLAAVYLAGLVFSLGRTLLRVHRTNRLLGSAVPVTERRVLDVWERVLTSSPLRGEVRLLQSPEIRVPMCFGLGRPAVVLPTEEGPSLAPEVLSCVLLHELVHLERRDTWVMLGQELVRSLFWFHPAAWWLCRRMNVLREISCDLLVVSRTGRRKRYASALVEYAAWMRRGLGLSEGTPSTALLPWTSSNSQLARRIEMLVSLSSNRSASRRTTILAAASAFSLLWGGQLALAAATTSQDDDEEVTVEEVADSQDVDDGDLAELVEVLESMEAEPVEDPEVNEWITTLEALELPEANVIVQMLGQGGDEPLSIELGELAEGGLLWVQDDETPMLGVRIEEIDSDDDRIVIREVIPGTAADRSDLQDGDVIVRINGERASWDRLNAAKKEMRERGMRLVVIRDGDEVEVRVARGEEKHKSKTFKVKPHKVKLPKPHKIEPMKPHDFKELKELGKLGKLGKIWQDGEHGTLELHLEGLNEHLGKLHVELRDVLGKEHEEMLEAFAGTLELHGHDHEADEDEAHGVYRFRMHGDDDGDEVRRFRVHESHEARDDDHDDHDALVEIHGEDADGVFEFHWQSDDDDEVDREDPFAAAREALERAMRDQPDHRDALKRALKALERTEIRVPKIDVRIPEFQMREVEIPEIHIPEIHVPKMRLHDSHGRTRKHPGFEHHDADEGHSHADDMHSRIREALEGVHDWTVEISPEQREKIHEAAREARQHLEKRKPELRYRVRGHDGDEHGHRSRRDRSDLEEELDKLRSLMHQREQELRDLRRRLDRLQRDRSHDQAAAPSPDVPLALGIPRTARPAPAPLAIAGPLSPRPTLLPGLAEPAPEPRLVPVPALLPEPRFVPRAVVAPEPAPDRIR